MERLLIKTDPQPEVRKNAENAKDWPYHDEASYLYRMAVLFKDRLIDPLHHLDRERLPDPVIAFENLRNYNTLAAFRLTRNPQGMQNEIIMNIEHYIGDEKKVWEYGRWAQLETLLHEQIHEYQQVYGKDPVKIGKVYHNKEFIDKCESLGLHPMPGVGCHTRVADGVFALLMKEMGIEPPQDVPKAQGKQDWFEFKPKKGTSTLTKWSCGCQNVRVGTKEFKAHCDVCGNPFIKIETQAQAMLGINEK